MPDFAKVHADDRYLDRLGSAQPDEDDFADDELAALLLSWRLAVDAVPIRELVDTKTATAVVRKARRRWRKSCA